MKRSSPAPSLRHAFRRLAALLVFSAVMAACPAEGRDNAGYEPFRIYSFMDLAECLEEHKEREFFESLHKYAHIERTAGHKFMLGLLYHHGIGVEADLEKAARWYREADNSGYAFPMLGNEAAAALGEIEKAKRDAGTSPGKSPGMEERDGACASLTALQIADMFFLGICAPLDYDKAKEWELRAAAAGDEKAIRLVASSYRNGENAYPRDAEQAEKWLSGLKGAAGESSVQNSHSLSAEMSFSEGVMTLDEQARAVYEEGLRFYAGGGAGADWHSAALRFHEAAAFGIKAPENHYLLGRIQEEGKFGVKNPYGAGKSYRIAALLGHGGAMLRLGMLHEQGLGVRRSREQAGRWYAGASRQGVKGADERRRLLRAAAREEEVDSPAFRVVRATAAFRAFFNHTPFRLPDEMRRAGGWLVKAAEAGQPEAMRLAGKYHMTGSDELGIPRDPERGERYLKQAGMQPPATDCPP